MINGPFDFDMDDVMEVAEDTLSQFEDLIEDEISETEDRVEAYDGEGN